MLENMQDIPLQSSHEAGMHALELEFLNFFVSLKSIYECQKKKEKTTKKRSSAPLRLL
ncbi:hypothetical protein [Helicobacter pylori]|uniref:hypothetical protein n=1 Tax=Helicobacter pylori TaxID=210 RepID=UPI001F0CD979|nr:hypothetical protein [Helicobacter pylori]